ncbi:MAG: GPP34 family phosphoprotein [Anaerolineae bacterium]|nr:GPP34 family phosphoprotein [Anaerolineae bacterium]
MLSLSEELFLLLLHDKNGKVTFKGVLPYALAGAILADLTLLKRLQLDENRRLLVADPSPTGNETLDEALRVIVESGAERPRRAKYLVNMLGYHTKKFQKTLTSQMVNKGVFSRQEKKYLWVIPYTVFPEQDAIAKYWIKQRLRSVVLAGENADQQTLALLSLLKGGRMLKTVFTKDERKAADQRIEALTNGEVFGSAVAKILEEIDAALVATTSIP